MYRLQSIPTRGQAGAKSATRVVAPMRDRLAILAQAFARGLARRWKGRLDRDHLASLEPSLLADIGVERHDIDSALGRAPWFYVQQR